MANQRIESRRINPTGVSVAVIIEKNDSLLCVRQKNTKEQKWSIPAGHLKSGEMILDGVKREVKEETGYDISLFGLVGIYNRPKEEGVRLAFVFTACIVGGQENPRPQEIAEIKWFNKNEISNLITSQKLYRPEYSARVLMDWMNGIIYPLDVFKEI